MPGPIGEAEGFRFLVLAGLPGDSVMTVDGIVHQGALRTGSLHRLHRRRPPPGAIGPAFAGSFFGW